MQRRRIAILCITPYIEVANKVHTLPIILAGDLKVWFSGLTLLVFGPRKLPELGKSLGDGIRGFKAAMKEQSDQLTGSGENAKQK